jgi:N-acetylmuramoyl-L-alanine amidase
MRKLILRILISISIAGSGAIGGYYIHTSKMDESHVRVVVDAGHGSIVNLVYQTFGKQSPEWPCGLKIWEGASNKLFAYDLVRELTINGIDAQLLNPELEDISLKTRVSRANSIYTRDKRTVFISLHHDAQPINETADYTDSDGLQGWTKGGANHIIVFTSVGETESDILANYIAWELGKVMPMPVYVREFNYYVLTNTYCPAILIEFGFMTSYESCQYIASDEGRKDYIKAVSKGIKMFNIKRKANE